jgi:hypothetical protein
MKKSPCVSQDSHNFSTGKQTSSIYNFDINKKAPEGKLEDKPEGKLTTGSIFNFDKNVKIIGKRSANVY